MIPFPRSIEKKETGGRLFIVPKKLWENVSLPDLFTMRTYKQKKGRFHKVIRLFLKASLEKRL
jgi:hypothetical protein